MANTENTIRSGRICGSPLNGLCYRMVVEVNQVFDGSVTNIAQKAVMLNLTDIPSEAQPPFMFINSTSTGMSKMENTKITRLAEERTRIEGTLKIEVTVTFKDSLGIIYYAKSVVSIQRDIILNTPLNSLIDYKIKNQVKLGCDIGTFLSSDTISAVICATILTKIIVKNDIVIPCYGNAVYPHIQEGDGGFCGEILRTPLFPLLD